MRKFYSKLSNELMDKAHYLDKHGAAGWKKKDLLAVLEKVYSEDFFIVGGDAFEKVNGALKSTCHSWFVKRQKNENVDNYLKKSYNETIKFLDQFLNEEEDKFIFFPTIVEKSNFYFLKE